MTGRRQRTPFARTLALILAVSAMVFGFAPSGARAQGGFEKTILLENDSVQVVKVRYAPGAASPLHTHKFPGRTIYVLQGGELELLPGGDASKAKRISIESGMTIWRPAETHIVRNVGTSETLVLEIEVKNLGSGG